MTYMRGAQGLAVVSSIGPTRRTAIGPRRDCRFSAMRGDFRHAHRQPQARISCEIRALDCVQRTRRADTAIRGNWQAIVDYGAIASASSAGKQLSPRRFLRKEQTRGDPRQGPSVQFLVRIEDVTAKAEEAIKGSALNERAAKLQGVYGEIITAATSGSGYEAKVIPMFKGNQYILFCVRAL